jgi:hypothetical protein
MTTVIHPKPTLHELVMEHYMKDGCTWFDAEEKIQDLTATRFLEVLSEALEERLK